MALKHEKPNQALLRELNELARVSETLLEALKGENRLPDNFPSEQLKEYVGAIIKLKDGTAEGCHQPLILARNELPRIRRKHIFDHETADEIEAEMDGDAIPPIRRDDKLDKALQPVISAITVTLDEYREQAAEDSKDELPQKPATDNPQTATVTKAIAQSETVEMALETAIAGADETLDGDIKEVDDFNRTLQDAHSANRMARGMLRGKTIVRRWYRASINNLKNYPGHIRNAGKAVRISAAIAGPVVERLNAITGELIGYGIDQWDKLGKMLEDVADNLDSLKKEWAGKTDAQIIPHVDPEILNAAEEQAIELLRQNQPVSDDIAIHVRTLSLMGTQFSKPDLLVNIPWLQTLYLRGNKITDFSEIEKLTNLRFLDLSSTKITGLDVIKKLTNLQEFYIYDTPITDLAGVKNLTNLQKIALSGTKITDIRALKGMTKLHDLQLARTNITDISTLKYLANLQILDLSGTKITDIRDLKYLTNLYSLDLSGTYITDIRILKYLTNLQILDLSDTKVTDWSPMAHLANVGGRPDDWDA